jgi:hypothetical protein
MKRKRCWIGRRIELAIDWTSPNGRKLEPVLDYR